MRVMGLRALYRYPRTSKSGLGRKVYPYLLRGMRIPRPNQVWTADITYIPMARGFLYLVVIMDWYSRYVLSWRLSNTMDTEFCLDALEEALSEGTPDIFNTDQGAQFTSEAFTGLLERQGVTVSMDGKGSYTDNLFIERRVDKAFPTIVSKAHFRRVNSLMRSRAPKFSHSRRVGSSFLLSGLAKCKTCKTPLTGQFAKSGQYTYFCQTIIKRGKDDCNTPRLNARRFEQLIVSRIRSSILSEDNVGDLTKVAVQELNGLAQEQRRRLESIESELADVRRRLDRLWDLVETSDYYDPADTSLQIKAHSERKRVLEASAAEATAVYQRRAVRDDVEAIVTYAQDMTEFLKQGELPERRAFIELFVKEIVVSPGKAVVRYTIPISQSTPKAAVLVGGGS